MEGHPSTHVQALPVSLVSVPEGGGSVDHIGAKLNSRFMRNKVLVQFSPKRKKPDRSDKYKTCKYQTLS